MTNNIKFGRKLLTGLVIAMSLTSIPMLASAQDIMTPPKAPPTKLPPIPRTNISTPIKLPPLPKIQDNVVVADNQIADDYDQSRLFNMLQEEVNRIQKAIEPEFSILLLRTDDENFKKYVANGILKVTTNDYSHSETGLQAMMVAGGKMNGSNAPVCYVMLEPKKAEHIWNGYVSPLAKVSHPSSGAAWIVAHEVGHCIDQQERNKKINKKMSWKADDVSSLGLEPNAVRMAYGNNFATSNFTSDPHKVYKYPSQKQYGERVADAFATMWMLKLGGSIDAVEVLKNRRSTMKVEAPHYTAPVFDVVKNAQRDWTRIKRIDDMWSLARSIQMQIGVSAEAVAAKPTSVESKTVAQDEKEKGKIVGWIVTSKGPVPINSEGDVVQTKANTVINQAPRNFRDLPRFGR